MPHSSSLHHRRSRVAIHCSRGILPCILLLLVGNSSGPHSFWLGTPAFAQTSEMEEMEASMREGEPGEDAAPIPTTQTGSDPSVIWRMVEPDFSNLSTELARLAAPPTVAPQPLRTGPVLLNESHVAFRYGNLPLAEELFFAHLALGGDAAAEDLDAIQFSPLLRRPTWHLRWGMALGVSGDTDVTDFHPVLDDGEHGDGQHGDGGPDRQSRDEQDAMNEQFEDEPEFMEDEFSDESRFDGPMNERDRPAPTTQTAPPARTTDPKIEMRLSELTGIVGHTLTQGMQSRFESGKLGSAFQQIKEDPADEGFTVGGEVVNAGDMPMWVPGIVYLGEGNVREMSQKAIEEKLEFLLFVAVNLKRFRNDDVENICRVKVVDCKSGKTLIASGAVDNREIARLTGRPQTLVDKQLESFWKIIDSRTGLTPLPTLTPEIARRRITQLMEDASVSTLRKLAEIQALHRKGWLTDAEREESFQILLGKTGIQILYAPTRDAVPILRNLARQAIQRPSDS